MLIDSVGWFRLSRLVYLTWVAGLGLGWLVWVGLRSPRKNLTLSVEVKVNLAGPCLEVIYTERELENLLTKRHDFSTPCTLRMYATDTLYATFFRVFQIF